MDTRVRPKGGRPIPDPHPSLGVEDPVISIGILAQRVGLSVSTVRKYANEGLVIPHRTEAGRRLFSQEDVARVANVRHMIGDLGLNIESIRRMHALLPCWELLPCDAETRARCPAYEDNTRPCWTIRGAAGCEDGNECSQCPVYRFGSLCTEEIKHLMHDPSERHDTGAAIRALLERRRQLHAMET